MVEPLPGNMETSPRDRAIALVKNLSSFLPGLGPLIAGIVLDDIPRQRTDRIQEFVEQLSSKVDGLDQKLAGCVPGSASLDILEEGMAASAKAFSAKQRARIASLVGYGLADSDRRHIETVRLLDLLAELDDTQVILLAAHSLTYRWDHAFNMRHLATLRQPLPSLASPQEEHDEKTVRDLGIQQLVGLGLLRVRMHTSRSRSLSHPEFEQVQTKASGVEISPLGELLLARAGLGDEDPSDDLSDP